MRNCFLWQLSFDTWQRGMHGQGAMRLAGEIWPLHYDFGLVRTSDLHGDFPKFLV